MLLRSGVHVKTAPPVWPGPWTTVWRNKDGLRCHVGRVYDEAMFDAMAEEYAQFQFPRKKPSTMRMIGGAIVTTAPDTNMSVSKSGGFLTSSVKVRYKTNMGFVAHGDPDIVDVPDSGYAFWPEGKFKNSNEPVYLILSRLTDENNENPEWVLGLSKEEDIWVYDIKIAVITGSQCVQLWHSDIVYAKPASQADIHPFKVEAVANQHKVKVYTGSVLNKVPTYPDGKALHGSPSGVEVGILDVPTSGTFDVFLQITSTQTIFPQSIIVNAAATMPAETLDVAYVRIVSGFSSTSGGKPRVSIGNQFIRTSLWGERMRLPSYSSTSLWRV